MKVVKIFDLTDREAKQIKKNDKIIKLYNPHFDISITIEVGNVHNLDYKKDKKYHYVDPDDGVPYAN